MLNPTIARRESPTSPVGEGRSTWRATLEAGAAILQDTLPLKDFDIYVAGLHCAKHEAHMQMEAHHFCRQVNQDFLQCTLFDGNTKDANLIGIEYIVSERVFDSLADEEKPYWHPHNYEILSGQLCAPGLPDVAERAFLKELMNSYGKTWHTWHTGRHDGSPGDRLPLGDPKLMWSFNRDGEADESLKQDFQQHMGLDEAAKREQRQSFVTLAQAQRGVDEMAGDFTGTTAIPGVVDAGPRP
ncbi:MAG: OBAP family protein [Solirubrobacteraceae bacterium]